LNSCSLAPPSPLGGEGKGEGKFQICLVRFFDIKKQCKKPTVRFKNGQQVNVISNLIYPVKENYFYVLAKGKCETLE